MELIKTKMGRTYNKDKYKDNLVLSIRKTRGTMTDETALFLGISEVGFIAFFKSKGKAFISVAVDGDDLEIGEYRKVSRVNGRFGMHTKSMVAAGDLETGLYGLKSPPISKYNKLWYKLEKISE